MKNLYRVRGLKTTMENDKENITLYFETTSFCKAVTKAKKVLSYIHEVVQIKGEILGDEALF